MENPRKPYRPTDRHTDKKIGEGGGRRTPVNNEHGAFYMPTARSTDKLGKKGDAERSKGTIINGIRGNYKELFRALIIAGLGIFMGYETCQGLNEKRPMQDESINPKDLSGFSNHN